MNNRLRELRKALGLTQKQLGDALHIQGSAVSKIENGENALTDANIATIYREYDVNPYWFETGRGEMFVEKTRDEEISSFMADVQMDADDSFRKRFINGLQALDADDWKALATIMGKVVNKMNEA